MDADDDHHRECLSLLETDAGPLIVPQLVITEVAYLIGTRLGADPEVRFLGDLAVGVFTIQPVHPSDWLRIAELASRHREFPLGTVDASVVALAEREGLDTVATLDRGHFSAVRPRHVPVLKLLP